MKDINENIMIKIITNQQSPMIPRIYPAFANEVLSSFFNPILPKYIAIIEHTKGTAIIPSIPHINATIPFYLTQIFFAYIDIGVEFEVAVLFGVLVHLKEE
jgi:hypothetical protein